MAQGPFLAIGNFLNGDGTNRRVNSVIYRWNGVAFSQFQEIPTVGGGASTFFQINNVPYIAVSNFGVADSHNSVIYRWNGTAFGHFQDMSTVGAAGWESFVLSGTLYLVLASYQTGTGFEDNSAIYQWDGAAFVWVR